VRASADLRLSEALIQSLFLGKKSTHRRGNGSGRQVICSACLDGALTSMSVLDTHAWCSMTETTILPRSGKKSTSSKTVKNGKSQREKPVGPDDAPARSERILASMLAFRDGDFTVRLPTNWSGTDGRIAGAFNQALRNEDRIAQEMTRLSMTVGEEGRLKQRMSLPGAIGGWATTVNSLNTLLDDLVRPTTEIARTIGAVAKGDLGQSMELEADARAMSRSSSRMPSAP
jgi:HAMP domain